ncbi:MAG: glycerol-3-phosphate 1-O-acyltransferase PlsY [Nitrospinota bacterium]|nr:glycerol-3-phosphate 1-O-acyltransferase PlsY [Nitrospinota bacterium]
MGQLAGVLSASYLLGAIPMAIIVGRIVGGIDIRTAGSGNAGATNVYRLFGLKPYLIVLGFDMFKGWAAVALVAPIGVGAMTPGRTAVYCGVAAVTGHVWTVFAGFRGGKGVATAGGAMLGLAPIVALVAVGVYLAVTLTTQYVALGSMAAAVISPLLVYLLVPGAPPELYILCFGLAVFIIFTHRVNIRRLMAGEEGKTDFLSKLRRQKKE